MILDSSYINSNRINQSRLKKILIHPIFYRDYGHSEDDEPSEVLLIGDAVDMKLTQGDAKFEENFTVATVERPSSKMGDFVWHLYLNRNHPQAEQIAYSAAEFSQDIKIVRKNFEEKGKAYYDQLIASEGKKVLTPSQFNTVNLIVKSFKENPFTKEYFKETEHIKIFKQVAIDFPWEHNGFTYDCKALLDMVVVDTLSGVIIPIDIKTTTTPLHFWADHFMKLRYDIQAAWYRKALMSHDLVHAFNIVSPFSQPEIKDFLFLVESQKYPGNPLIFEVDPSIINLALEGGVYKGNYYEGIYSAFDRLAFHNSTDKWDYRKEDYENNGVRRITCNP